MIEDKYYNDSSNQGKESMKVPAITNFLRNRFIVQELQGTNSFGAECISNGVNNDDLPSFDEYIEEISNRDLDVRGILEKILTPSSPAPLTPSLVATATMLNRMSVLPNAGRYVERVE